jgi:hypothetical protein
LAIYTMTAHIPYSKETKNEFNQYYPGSATGE